MPAEYSDAPPGVCGLAVWVAGVLEMFFHAFVFCMFSCLSQQKWLLHLILQISLDLWRKIKETIFKMRNL